MKNVMSVNSELGKFKLVNTLTIAAASLLAGRVVGNITSLDIETAVYDAARVMQACNESVAVKE